MSEKQEKLNIYRVSNARSDPKSTGHRRTYSSDTELDQGLSYFAFDSRICIQSDTNRLFSESQDVTGEWLADIARNMPLDEKDNSLPAFLSVGPPPVGSSVRLSIGPPAKLAPGFLHVFIILRRKVLLRKCLHNALAAQKSEHLR